MSPRDELRLAILKYRKDTEQPLQKILLAALEYLDSFGQ